MVANQLAITEFGMEFCEEAIGFGGIAIRGQTHGFTFTIAMPPAQRFSYVAIKPAEGRGMWKRLKQFDFAVFAAPEGIGNFIAYAIHGDD